MEQTIPVVDLNDWRSRDSERRAAFVQSLGAALEDIGFFALINHGVDSGLIKQAYGVAEEFFNHDEATKKRFEKLELKGQRGYTSFGREHAKGSEAPDLKEFYHVGRDSDAAGPANLWPEVVPSFRPTMSLLFTQLDACAGALLEACALYVNAPRQRIADAAVDGQTILRVIHYPPVSEDANPAGVRAAAHEDINLITLLCESTAAGLELLQRDGSWRPVHSLGGQIIVDSGDMLQQWSNGLFKSTTHRVVNPDNNRDRRFSMPFFVHPRSEVDLTPMPECVERTGGKALFPNITAGEYLQQRLEEIGLS